MINENDTLTEQDQYMLILIDKIDNYYKDEIKLDDDLDLTMNKSVRAYCTLSDYIDRSPELYSFIISVILSNDMSLEEIESVRLNDKDEEDIMYYIKELIFYNQKEMSPLFFKNGETIYTVPYVTLKLNKINNTFFHSDNFRNLVLISALIKIFAKVNHKYKDKYNDLYKKYKSLVAINENRIQDKKDIENMNNLRKEIENSKEKNKELTIEKERLNKRYDILNDENNNLKNNIKSLNKDIEDLREILNIMDPEDETEDKLTSQVDRIVLTEEEEKTALLIGGHIRFQQKVLEKYPNLRTVTVDIARVNVQLIKNSKLVLLNVKYMSHKLFESVMNVVKKNNIEFRYV